MSSSKDPRRLERGRTGQNDGPRAAYAPGAADREGAENTHFGPGSKGDGTKPAVHAKFAGMSDLYDTDTYTWAKQQADALRRRSANEVDWDNVAEEIESVGKSQASELRSRYAILLLHLLKWRYQPERRSRSWEATIRVQRKSILDHLEENPGLRARRDELLGRAYFEARQGASGETDLPVETFPETNPFTLAEAMDESFWPDAPTAK